VVSRNPILRWLLITPFRPGCSKRSRCKAEGARPSEAYSRYAAASAQAVRPPPAAGWVQAYRRDAFSAACQTNLGMISFGMNSTVSGNMITSSSAISIGIRMMMISLRTCETVVFAMATSIKRQSP
jgi:hypothetical protein